MDFRTKAQVSIEALKPVVLGRLRELGELTPESIAQVISESCGGLVALNAILCDRIAALDAEVYRHRLALQGLTLVVAEHESIISEIEDIEVIDITPEPDTTTEPEN